MLIIVNGTPSSGKTSASREFIEIIDDLFVYASYDNFKEMLPQKYSSINPSDGFYVKKYSSGGHQIIIGKIGNKFLLQSIKAVESLLLDNWNVIFDIVESDQEILFHMLNKFKKICSVKSFYLYANHQEIKNRQNSRDDRDIDTTQYFIDKMKDIEKLHDFSLDTSKMNPSNIAYYIKNRIN